MLLWNDFENLPTVMAILVLLEQFSDKFCLFALILSALVNMMHVIRTFPIITRDA